MARTFWFFVRNSIKSKKTPIRKANNNIIRYIFAQLIILFCLITFAIILKEGLRVDGIYNLNC